jgi:hypothetical protein
MKLRWQTICLCLLFFSCTTVGIPDKEAIQNIDFGPPEELRICIYKDINISDQQADDIITALQQEFSHFDLIIEVPWIRPWDRPAYTGDEIMNNFAACPLEAPCDRLLALVGRNFTDFLWGIVMPEIFGAVEDVSMTKGFVVAEVGSLNQLVSMSSAGRIAIHEMYHLLGCDHSFDAKPCYEKIKLVKKIARQNRMAGNDFFPSILLDKQILFSRPEVEKKLESYQKIRLLTCEDISSE